MTVIDDIAVILDADPSTVVERHLRAMGTEVHLLTVGAPAATVESLERRLHQLETRWSRFIDSSEVSRLNRQPELFHLVSDDTAELVQRSVQAWDLTDGSFDPTVLDAVAAAGYDRSFDEIADVTPGPMMSAPGCGTVEVDRDLGLIRLGADVHLDPGGLGKGLAADLLVAHALAAGADGALVNIGGDIVCDGRAPTSDGWIVDVTEPAVHDGCLALLGLQRGAVATSTTRKRRWATEDGERHHLIDPATGASTTGPVLVTVIAAHGWYAEAVAKQLAITGDPDMVDAESAAAIMVFDDGTVQMVGPIDRYLVGSGSS